MTLLRSTLPWLLFPLLVACSGPSGSVGSPATPAGQAATVAPPTHTSAPTATRVPPTPTAPATPTPTSVPTATATATVPTATATVDSRPTGAPTPTATRVAASTPTEAPETATPEAPTLEATATPEQPAARDVLAAEIDALIEGREGLYEVVVGPPGAQLYERNAGEQVQSASLYKLLIMVEVYHQLDAGIIAPDDSVFLDAGFFKEAGFDDPFGPNEIGSTVTVEELLRPMVALSSNVAAFALLDLVGNVNVNRTAAELGMTASEIRWMPALGAGSVEAAPPSKLASYAGLFGQAPTPLPPTADEAFNVTSAADTALLFSLLLDGRVVNREASDAMLDLLAQQVVNDRLPALLPPGTVVAHKTGNIDNVNHDVGVIYTPAGPIVVVVLTRDALEWEAVEFMRELAALVYSFGLR